MHIKAMYTWARPNNIHHSLIHSTRLLVMIKIQELSESVRLISCLSKFSHGYLLLVQEEIISSCLFLVFGFVSCCSQTIRG